MSDAPSPEDRPSPPAPPPPPGHGGWTAPAWTPTETDPRPEPGTATEPGTASDPDPVAAEWAPTATNPPAPGRHGSALRSAVEWVAIVVAALVAALVIKAFVIQAFYIPSASMEPTLKIGDRVLVNKLSYDFHDVNRGDIVVFNSPPGEDNPAVKDLIKRVIGLPGETVEGRDGRVYINGSPLKEP